MFMNLNSVEDYILSSWHSVDKLRWIRLFRNWTKTSMNIIFRIALKSKKKISLKGLYPIKRDKKKYKGIKIQKS